VLWDDDPRGQVARAVDIALAACTCDDRYHVIWPLLRAAGIKGTLRPREDEILSDVLDRLVGKGARILIAGSADTATFATVGRMAAARAPDFTVLDRCKAPLALIEDFAAKRGMACRTLREDLFELRDEALWDVVLLHYTFQFIAPDRRTDVMARLSRALVPGGTLLCVSKDVVSILPGDVSAAAARWLEKTRHRLKADGLDSAVPQPLYDDLLRQAAEGRTLRRLNNPSSADIGGFMRTAGLILLEEHVTAQTQRLDGTRTGSAPESSVILAAKRASSRLETAAPLG